MTIALYAGSFDPVTLGHVDIARRALRFADELVVAVGVNASKRYLFDHDTRVAMVKAALSELPAVSVVRLDAPLVSLAHTVGADILVKGVRSGADLEWECAQASVNRDFGEVETVLLPALPELSLVSSSIVRELLGYEMDVSRYVPEAIYPFLRDNTGGDGPR